MYCPIYWHFFPFSFHYGTWYQNERGAERFDPVLCWGDCRHELPRLFPALYPMIPNQGVLQMISFPEGDSAFVLFHPPSIPSLHQFILPLFFQLQTVLPRKYLYVLATQVARSQRANFTGDALNRHAMEGFLRKNDAKWGKGKKRKYSAERDRSRGSPSRCARRYRAETAPELGENMDLNPSCIPLTQLAGAVS